jgi:hypothetical protein
MQTAKNVLYEVHLSILLSIKYDKNRALISREIERIKDKHRSNESRNSSNFET